MSPRKQIQTPMSGVLCGTLMWLMASSTTLPQANPTRPPTATASPQMVVFAISGRVYTDYSSRLPEILEVRLEKVGSLVGQTFVRSDHNFEFRDLHAGTYHVIIRNEQFEEINTAVDLYGQFSQTFVITLMLTPKTKEAEKSQHLEADDDLGDTISVLLLSQKIPGKAVKHYRKSLVLDQKKKYPEAIMELQKATAMAPDFYSAFRNWGILLYKTGQGADAIPPLLKAVQINPRSAKTNYFLGLSYLKIGNLEMAREYFAKTIFISPEKAAPYYFQGYILYKQNHLAEAERSLKEAMEKNSFVSSFSRLQLANVYLKESSLRDAYEQMELFLKESPDAAEISQVMSNLKVLREIIALAPSTPDAQPPKVK